MIIQRYVYNHFLLFLLRYYFLGLISASRTYNYYYFLAYFGIKQ